MTHAPFLFAFALGLALCGAPLLQAEPPFVKTVEELDDEEKANWIAPPMSESEETGLYLFRKTFELEEVPSEFVVHVTADPRYKLYVNGVLVTIGPAAGDDLEWRYASIDIAERLQRGENLIAVEVWDAGRFSGARQVSIRTAMLLEGPEEVGFSLQSDASWKVLRSPGWTALPMDSATVGGGYIAGATERFEAGAHPRGWHEQAEFDDSDWPNAIEIGKGSHGGLNTWLGTSWTLRERPIPLLEMQQVEIGKIRDVALNGRPLPLEIEWPIVMPPNSRFRALIDRGVIGVGFPRLSTRGGAGSDLRLRYQEALFKPEGGKGNRDEIDGKVMKGYYDELLLSGGEGLTYEPAWIRTYRYLEIVAETADEPLTLESLDLLQVGYPFDRRGSFSSSDPSLARILEASWNTVEVCALETYMDCPYYEQVQYIGDTRIQALISLYMTGDDRLMRNAILQFHRSRQPEGLTTSAFPVRDNGAPQLIPPFSLVYVSMVHDYYMHREDSAFIASLLPGIRYTLEWFLQRLDERGLLGALPYWNHTDGGARGFYHGSPPGASKGGSIQLTLLLVAALEDAAALCEAFQENYEAQRFRRTADGLRAAVRLHGYDAERKLFAETPAKQVFSQHTNAYAILTDTVAKEEQSALAERLVNDPELIQGTLYFQFYIFSALREANRGDLILSELDRWRKMLSAGLTTFPEHGIESRSDAHAWAAHPLYHLLATTAGVTPAEPGFRTVRIRPAPGDLGWLDATMCHPDGLIEVRYDSGQGGRQQAEIVLPEGVSGVLEWQGTTTSLHPGRQKLEL